MFKSSSKNIKFKKLIMWYFETFPDDEPEFECRVCGVKLFEDVYVCSNECFLADQL